jgi:hypothetical protein
LDRLPRHQRLQDRPAPPQQFLLRTARRRAIGLIDARLAIDELDQRLGVYYDDENVLPAPEGPGNPVVEVWNNTPDDSGPIDTFERSGAAGVPLTCGAVAAPVITFGAAEAGPATPNTAPEAATAPTASRIRLNPCVTATP